MGYNKVILGDDVLLDLSGDTVTPGALLNGYKAHDKSGSVIQGTMPDNGTVTKTLDVSTTSYTIPAGKHSGSGKVSISTQEKSVTPSTSAQTVTPDSGKVLSKVSVGAVPSATQATPSISVSSTGLITASVEQTEGYVAKGTKSATKQLTTKAAETITPGTSNQTIAPGQYLTGTQTIKGDSNLKAANIKKGVSIFGVSGSYEAPSSGKQVYSGTVTGGNATMSINVGATISSSDIFVLVYSGNACDDTNQHSGLVTAAMKNASKNVVIYSTGGIVDYGEGSYSQYPIINVKTNGITYSGKTVSITPGSSWYGFINDQYTWYLIKG